ncbi:MAG: hypothetical protein IPP74_01690 [Alphaproteobacteria bacterium]|nr:hypothetical protein [Alphaproteobacteria bacterium]
MQLTLDDDGNQALYFAAKSNNVAIFKALMDRGAITNTANFQGILWTKDAAGLNVKKYLNEIHTEILQQIKVNDKSILGLGFDGSINESRQSMIFASQAQDRELVAPIMKSLYSQNPTLRPRLHGLTLLAEAGLAQVVVCPDSLVSSLSPLLPLAGGVYNARSYDPFIIDDLILLIKDSRKFNTEFYVSHSESAKEMVATLVHEGGHLLDHFYQHYCSDQRIELDVIEIKYAVMEWFRTNEVDTIQKEEIRQIVLDELMLYKAEDQARELFVRIHQLVVLQGTDEYVKSISPLWEVYQQIIGQETLLVKHLIAHQFIRHLGLHENDNTLMQKMADVVITQLENDKIVLFDMTQATPPLPLAERLPPEYQINLSKLLRQVQSEFLRFSVSPSSESAKLYEFFLAQDCGTKKNILKKLWTTNQGIQQISLMIILEPKILLLVDTLRLETGDSRALSQLGLCLEKSELFADRLISNKELTGEQKLKIAEILQEIGFDLQKTITHNEQKCIFSDLFLLCGREGNIPLEAKNSEPQNVLDRVIKRVVCPNQVQRQTNAPQKCIATILKSKDDLSINYAERHKASQGQGKSNPLARSM